MNNQVLAKEILPNGELLNEVDAALSEDLRARRRETEVRNAKEAAEKSRIGGLSRIMRQAGAALLITAAAVFLVQGWGEMEHLTRYFSFLGFTAAMCVAGFFCGIRIKEDKGARTFMALTALVVPVHFAQLGALLYSASPYTIAGVQYPAFLTWIAPDPAAALMTAAIGIAALLPVTLIAFLSLARKKARLISLVYLTSCAALLIPFRDPDIMAFVIAALAAVFGYFDLAHLSRDSSMRTPEGTLVRGMLAVPLLITLTRTLQLYQPTEFFIAVLFALAAAGLHLYIPRSTANRDVQGFSEGIAVAPAAVSWFLLTHLATQQITVAPEHVILLAGLPLAAIYAVLALTAQAAGNFLRFATRASAMGAVALQLAIFTDPLAAVICLLTAVLIMVESFARGSSSFLIAAAAVFAFGLIRQVVNAIEVYTLSPWLSLAVLGMLTIIAGSFVERNYSSIVRSFRQIGANFGWLEK